MIAFILLPSATATFRVGHISSSLLRSSDDLLLRSFSVGPVLRPGLNSIHFTQSDDTFRRSSLSANPAIRSTRRFCRLQRHVVVFCFLTLALFALMATGAGVGGWVPKFFWSSFCPGHLRCSGAQAACSIRGMRRT